MISTIFETEKDYDFVTIDNTKYSGSTEIDTILSTNFTVVFQSDGSVTKNGFVLNWNCVSQQPNHPTESPNTEYYSGDHSGDYSGDSGFDSKSTHVGKMIL